MCYTVFRTSGLGKILANGNLRSNVSNGRPWSSVLFCTEQLWMCQVGSDTRNFCSCAWCNVWCRKKNSPDRINLWYSCGFGFRSCARTICVQWVLNHAWLVIYFPLIIYYYHYHHYYCSTSLCWAVVALSASLSYTLTARLLGRRGQPVE
jgi:hypothetical protein